MNKKNTLINICAALITFIVQMIISLWLTPFVVSRLGEDAYGFINFANNFVAYASLLSVALNSMASRYISITYNTNNFLDAQKYFCSVLIANSVLYGFLLIISMFFIWKMEIIINVPIEILFQVKITFLLSFINMGTSLVGTVYTAAAFTTNKMHYASVVQVLSNVVKCAIVFILFSYLPTKVYYLSIATLVAGLVTIVGNYKVTRILFPNFRFSLKLFDLHKIIILFKSGSWILISNISNLFLNGFDLLLSNLFISAAIMGRLSIAKQIPLALSSALGILSNIFSSELTKEYAVNGDENIIASAKEQLKILTFFFTVPYAGIIAVGPDFLRLWLKNARYSQDDLYNIYVLIIIILLDIIVSTYMYSIHSIFIALDKVKIYSKILLVSSIISIIMTVVLLSATKLGVFAIAGTSTVVLGITHAVIVPALAAKTLNKSICLFWWCELKSWGVLICTVIIFKLISKLLCFNSWIDFLCSVIIMAAVGYLLSIFLIFNSQELNVLKRVIFK